MTRTLRTGGGHGVRRGRPMARLLGAARALGAPLDAVSLFQAIAEGGARVRDAAVCTLRLAEPGPALRLVATAAPPGVAPHAGALDEDLSGHVLSRARPLLVRDARLDRRVRSHDAWRAGGYAAWYGVPLPGADAPVGVLGLALPAGATMPVAEERRLLEMYATQAALAIRASRLSGTVERQMAALEVAKAELLEAAKLLALGHLVSDVVHEASNVLGTIMLRMGTLLEGPRDAETERQLHALDAHCRQIGDLIGELRRFAGGSARSVGVDVEASLERLLRLREPRLRSRGVRLVRDFAGALPTIAADRAQIERALMALLLDAEAGLAAGQTSAGRNIYIRTAARRDAGRAWVSVAIEDDGAPIPPDLMPHVFDPFAPRVHGRGPSMGLAAAYAMITAHHGRLTAANRPGGGVAFVVDLPASR